MTAKQDSASERRYVPKFRASWVPMALTALVVAVVAIVGYFGLQYLRGSTFQEGRSFRVLREVAQQFDNMQGSMASLLTLVPETLFVRDETCKLDPVRVDSYLEKLALPQIQLNTLLIEPDQPATYTFRLFLDDPKRPFAISRRGSIGSANATECVLQITGSLKSHLPLFANQRYFDQVLLALPSGTILAAVNNRAADDLTIDLQEDTSDSALVADARPLLAQAAVAQRDSAFGFGDKDGGAVPAEGTVPQHAVAFRRTIGERTYEISVLPIASANIIEADDAAADRKGPEEFPTLYLLGLKREDLAQQAGDALGSGGAFAATIVVLLGVLLWPFLSLRFSPADSAIAGFQVFGVVVSLVLLPVVLTASAAWVWSQMTQRTWADRGAEDYALQLDRALTAELDQAAWLLRSYSTLRSKPPRGSSAPIRRDLAGAAVNAAVHPQDCESDGSVACKLFLTGRIEPPDPILRNWSPLRTAVLLDAKGRSTPPRISAFGDVPVKSSVNLQDRKYFQALRADQAWKPRWMAGNSDGFVAQRLFNRADAARVLQVAVPRESRERWKGIVTGDTRAYALTAGVRPPLLRFAVIDRENGNVLFHTSDERSLTENLLVESEHNAQLQQAMQARRSNRPPIELTDHFEGKYLGESHRFYYRPINGIPWAIVVFYSTESLSDIAFDAAIATMTHCISVISLIVLAIVVIAFLWNKRIDRHMLAAVWPQWEWRLHYARIALALTAFWIIALVALLFALRTEQWSASLIAIALAGIGAWFVARSRWHVVRKPGIGAYRLFYAWTAVAALCVVVVLPTLLLAIGYQDMSTREYLRGQLFHASLDIERREMLMRRDLRRWVPSDRDRSRNYPSATSLVSALPVPAYQLASAGCDVSACWMLSLFDELPWINVAGPSEGGYFRRLIWRNVTLSNPRHHRSGRRSPPVVSDTPESDPARTGGSIQEQSAAPDLNSTVQLRRRDLRVVAKGRDDSNILQRREDCGGGSDRAAGTCVAVSPDILHRDRRGSFNAALLLGACLILILSGLVAMTARRLCGIRIPFAPRFVDPPDKHLPFGALLATEQRIDQARAEFGEDFTGKDAIDIRRIESGPHYREVWRSLSGDERHLLHQLSLGYFANPENTAIIERLLHRGYIRLRPWPVITDPGLADFARTAPQQEEFRQDQLDWATAAAGSTWHRIRIPLLSGGVMIAIGLMTFAGGTMQILLTSLAGISALLGHVSNVTNFVRKGEPGK